MRPRGVIAGLAALSLGAVSTDALAEPNITGVWRLSRPPKTALETTPAIPAAPLTPEAATAYRAQQAKSAAAEAEGRPLARDQELCVPLGMPRMLTTDNPIEILQTPGRVTLITEFLSQVRRIDLTRKTHPSGEDLAESFFGDSIGRWEGDTLVVDTVGLKGRVLLFLDAPHSDQLHIVERIRLLTPDILSDEVTMTDPKTLTQPWTVTRVFVRQSQSMIGEFVCEENNRNYRDANGRLGLRIP